MATGWWQKGAKHGKVLKGARSKQWQKMGKKQDKCCVV